MSTTATLLKKKSEKSLHPVEPAAIHSQLSNLQD